MTASTEALALVALVANGPKYRERLQELIAATEKADVAVANLKVAEKASAEKLEAAEALLGSLTAQTDEITAANEAAAASRVAAENDLARRSSELEAAKVAHAAEVARSLEMFANREQELSLKLAAVDERVASQTRSLHEGQAGLRAKHLELRSIIGQVRQGLAAAS